MTAHKIILDSDPGIDDALAVLYLASVPTVRIVGLGTVHGNIDSHRAADNALQVLELAGLRDVPVAVGARKPLNQPLRTSPEVHGEDGLGGAARPVTGRGVEDLSAAEQLVALARKYPGECTVLALGPLTNLAVALHLEPRLPELVRDVVIMGGSIEAPGNVSPVAEANIYHDPEAAQQVFEAAWPVTLVGLDVTMRIWLTSEELDKIAAADTATARFASEILRHYVGFYSQQHGRTGCALHDPSVAILAVIPELAKYADLPLHVELRGEHTRGMTVADRRDSPGPGPRVRVAMEVDRDGVMTTFLDGLLRLDPGSGVPSRTSHDVGSPGLTALGTP